MFLISSLFSLWNYLKVFFYFFVSIIILFASGWLLVVHRHTGMMVLSPQEISSIHLNQNQLSNACIWRFESATGIPIKSIELVKIENGIVQSLSGFSGGKECIAEIQSFSMNPNKLIITNGYNISVLLNKIVIVMTVKNNNSNYLMLCSIDGKDVLFGGVDSYTKRLITIGNTNSLKSINLEMGNTVLVTSTETSVNRTPSDTSISIPYQIMLKIM